MDALVLIAKVTALAATFVVTIGIVERLLGAGYGRSGRLHPRVVEVVSAVIAIASVLLVLSLFVLLHWL